jgi:hypothetical protein
LLLLVAFGCNVVIARFTQSDLREAKTKEAPMKVTKKSSRRIVKITKLEVLTTVANVATALAATSG